LTDKHPRSPPASFWSSFSSVASSGEAAVHAVAALTTLLRIALSDAACAMVDNDSATVPSQLKVRGVSELLSDICLKHSRVDTDIVAVAAHLPAHQPATLEATVEGVMRVQRTPRWLADTAAKLAILLPPLFGVLCKHARSSVRAAAAGAAAELMTNCSRTLASCSCALLECLLCSALDAWPQVSDVASRALGALQLVDDEAECMCMPATPAATCRIVLPWGRLETVISKHVDSFASACSRSERDVVAVARVLACAISAAGPSRFASEFLLAPSRRTLICQQLAVAFSLSGGPASKVSYLVSSASGTSNVARPLTSLPRRHRRLSLLCSDEVRLGSGRTCPKDLNARVAALRSRMKLSLMWHG
jgi:hypothetical protein